MLPFCRSQRQRCIKILCPKDPDFYKPLALKAANGQHLPALEVYKNQSPNYVSVDLLGGPEQESLRKCSPECSRECSQKSECSCECPPGALQCVCVCVCVCACAPFVAGSLLSLSLRASATLWRDTRPFVPVSVLSALLLATAWCDTRPSVPVSVLSAPLLATTWCDPRPLRSEKIPDQDLAPVTMAAMVGALPIIEPGTTYPPRLSHAITAVLRGGDRPERELHDLASRIHMRVTVSQVLLCVQSERRDGQSRFLLREHQHQWWIAVDGRQVILQAPTAHGGLSLLRLHHEALLHCISGLLALPAEGVPLTPTEQDSLTLATAILQLLTGVNAPAVSAHLLPHRRAAHLRRVVYDALALTLVTDCPWLLPPPPWMRWLPRPGLLCASSTASFWAGLRRMVLISSLPLFSAMPWPSTVALPIFPLPARCQYVTLTSGTACMHPLDPHGSHIHACSFGPRQRRRDAMRDTWCSLLRRAGWTAADEQLVHTAPQVTKRADLLATTPGGLAFALDLTFTSPLDDAASGPHLHRVHHAKAARYGVTPNQPLTHGPTLVPITYSATRPFLHSHAVHLLYRAVMATAGLHDPPAAGFHLASLTREFAAQLGRCFQTWVWRMAFSCQPR